MPSWIEIDSGAERPRVKAFCKDFGYSLARSEGTHRKSPSFAGEGAAAWGRQAFATRHKEQPPGQAKHLSTLHSTTYWNYVTLGGVAPAKSELSQSRRG